MPVAVSYPGVYIEEIPSGVHTITGVSTAITAFIGYTARGNVDEPVHIFSFADFERAFGSLAVDSPLSYCVKDFFQNGGTEAYVVRVAHNATPATVTLKNKVSGGNNVLTVTAASAGTWGNYLQVDVNYDTLDPLNLFNLQVASFVDRNGQMIVDTTEIFRNLSMNPLDPAYVLSRAGNSQLVTISLAGPLPAAVKATSVSGALTNADAAKVDATHNRLAFTLNGRGPYETSLSYPLADLAALKTEIAAKFNAVAGMGSVVTSSTATSVTVTSQDGTFGSAIHIFDTATNSAAAVLKLGRSNGGTELEAQADIRPAQTGDVSDALSFPLPGTAKGSVKIAVKRGSAILLSATSFPFWKAADPAPSTADDLLANVRMALSGSAEPLLAGASASLINGRLRILPGPADPNINFEFTADSPDTTATDLALISANAAYNVARYAPGLGVSLFAQVAGAAGNNGSAPLPSELTGIQANKTGMYALEDVDLFNLLVMPEASAGNGVMGALTEAIAYCTRRRAFMVIDLPDSVTDFAKAQTFMGSVASPLRSRNAALYFPRLRAPDPLRNSVGNFPAAGAIAGLFARTDAERGVWKAPAGTSAAIVGATGLSYTLTNSENGVLNPLGLNCLRTFPVYGTISWGARTGRGADALADEYKYIPVRRLALFLEESLYRGTQWTVFEPNDEPLWAQIRLNLGAFMHTLFAQGAFQGRTPREAYFVKCDKETTTQNDIDLGRVNIVVGFAPLKPAEFVIIQIQQIAGAIQT